MAQRTLGTQSQKIRKKDFIRGKAQFVGKRETAAFEIRKWLPDFLLEMGEHFCLPNNSDKKQMKAKGAEN
jgi:hypothetical protein